MELKKRSKNLEILDGSKQKKNKICILLKLIYKSVEKKKKVQLNRKIFLISVIYNKEDRLQMVEANPNSSGDEYLLQVLYIFNICPRHGIQLKIQTQVYP